MKKDFILTFITEFIVILCLLTTYKLADYFFGQKGFTDYSLARRVIAMLQPIFLVGMHITIPRQVAFYSTESKQKSSEIFLSAVIILFAVTFILSFVMLVFKKQFAAILFDSPSYIKFIFPLILMIAGMTIHAAVYGYYRGIRMMKKANLIQLLMMGIIPVFAISFAAGVAQSFIITGVLWIIISLLFLTGIILKQTFSFSSVVKNIRYTFNHGVQRLPADLGIAALLSLPVVFFTHAFGTTQSGYLAFSISLLSMTGASLKPIGLIMLPHATTMIAEKNYALLHSQIRKMIFYFLLLSAIVIAGYELLAPALISIYLGKANPELVYISRIIMLSAAGYMFYVFFRSIIDAAHHRSYNTVNIIISLTALIALSSAGFFFNVSRTYLLSIFVLSVSLLGTMTYLYIKKILKQE
jgi:O-antigen/teichoic acid export membrane protein